MDYRAKEFVQQLIKRDLLICTETQEEQIAYTLSNILRYVESKAVESNLELVKIMQTDIMSDKESEFSKCIYGNDSCPKCN